MNRLLFWGFVLLLVSPFYVSAETATHYARYCPDPTKDFFKGSIYHENGEPWIEVKVDPEFEQKVLLAERKIGGNIPLTPVYDLVVRIKPEFNYYCIPGWAEGQPVTAVQLPQTLPVDGFLTIGATDEAIVGPGSFKRTNEKDEQGRFVYEWELKGWQNGIAPDKKMEKLIEAISKNQPVNVMVEIPQKDGTKTYAKSSIPFNACVPIWGSGEHKVVGMYDEGRDATEIVSYFDTVREVGFAKVEPYASNQSFFSYFVDLKKVVEGTIEPITQIVLEAKKAGFRSPTLAIQNNVLARYINASSCQNGIYLLKVKTANNSLPRGVGGVALLGGSARGALIDTEGAQLVAGSRGASDVSVVYVHEFSHTFAGLNDEYVYKAQSLNIGLPLRNCTKNPFANFSVNGKLYGSTRYQGCSFQYDADDKPSVPSARYYRPSRASLMNTGEENEFNVVSCGYIMSAIKGGDAKSYFPECAAMDGVIKDGVTAQNVFAPIFAWFENVGLSPTSLTAEAGAASSVVGKVKVIVSQNAPPAEFEALSSAEAKQVKSPDVCLDATGQIAYKNKQQPFRADVERRWKNEAQCAQNIVRATLLKQQIVDSDASFAAADAFKDSVEMTKKTLPTALSPSQSITLVAVPVGGVIKKKYQVVEDISMQCVVGSAIPIGTGVIDEGGQVVAITAEQAKQMTELKKKAKALSEDYAKVAGDVAKHGGKNTITTPARTLLLANSIKNLFKNMQQGFVLLSPEAVAKNHPSLKEQDMFTLSFAVTPQIPCALPSLPGIMKKFGDLNEDTKFTTVTATFDGNTLSGLCVPADDLLSGLAAMSDTMQTVMWGIHPDVKKELKDMEASGYGCNATAVTGVAGTSAGKIVRKSLSPQAPQPANGTDTSSEQSGTTDSSSSNKPSYLIVESFDPNNQWGEIIRVGEDEIAITTATTTPTEVASTTPSFWERVKKGVLGVIGRLTGSSATPTEPALPGQPNLPADVLRAPAREVNKAPENITLEIPCGAPITTPPTPSSVKTPEPTGGGFGYSSEGGTFNYDATNYQTANDSSLITLRADGAGLSWTTWKEAYICHLNGVYVPVVGSHKLVSHAESCSYTLVCSDEKQTTRATKSVTVLAK